MNISKLTPMEFAVVEWQYNLCGGFKSALWGAIKRADLGNLERLRLGFPLEVEGFIAYSQEPGWWPAVQTKLNAAGEAANGSNS